VIAAIKAKYTGVPVGASESICIFLAQATGLNLITPLPYMKAENDGTDPPAASVAEFNQQIVQHQIKVFLLNVQTISNATRSLQANLTQSGIPVVEISETVRPVNATFEQWQLSQLQALQKALAQAIPNA
jgi:zinc/manganese transport system substrate-binding protein